MKDSAIKEGHICIVILAVNLQVKLQVKFIGKIYIANI